MNKDSSVESIETTQLFLERRHLQCPWCYSFVQFDIDVDNICPVCSRSITETDILNQEQEDQ